MPQRAKPHRPPGARTRQQQQQAYDRKRSGSESRKFYCGRPWRRLRAAFLGSNPLCMDCKAKGLLTAATQVHHRLKREDRPDLALEADNLLSLCPACHTRRTRKGE